VDHVKDFLLTFPLVILLIYMREMTGYYRHLFIIFFAKYEIKLNNI
jgi:hypothetical protein